MNKIISMIIALVAANTAAWGHDIKGEFAQYTPEQRQWLQDQTVPGKTVSCCNIADGTRAQEDIKGDQYWVSFEACYSPGNYSPPLCGLEGPMPVPYEAVLKGPNKIGPPIVWYGWDTVNGDRKIWIRCYQPGAGL